MGYSKDVTTAVTVCWSTRTLICCLLFAGGCASHAVGEWSMEIAPGEGTLTEDAPRFGYYDLYAGPNTHPTRHAIVVEGDPVGFSRDANGQLIAIAGNKTWRLREGTYHWLLPEARKTTDSSLSLTDVVCDAGALSLFVLLELTDVALSDWADRQDSGAGQQHPHGGNHHGYNAPHKPPATQPHPS